MHPVSSVKAAIKVYLRVHGRHSFLLILEAANDLEQTLHSEQKNEKSDEQRCSKRLQPPRGTRVLWQASDEVGKIKRGGKRDKNTQLLGGGALESLLAALPVLTLQFGQVVLLLHRLPCYQPLVQP